MTVGILKSRYSHPSNNPPTTPQKKEEKKEENPHRQNIPRDIEELIIYRGYL